jgi:hypothetical protein
LDLFAVAVQAQFVAANRFTRRTERLRGWKFLLPARATPQPRQRADGHVERAAAVARERIGERKYLPQIGADGDRFGVGRRRRQTHRFAIGGIIAKDTIERGDPVKRISLRRFGCGFVLRVENDLELHPHVRFGGRVTGEGLGLG